MKPPKKEPCSLCGDKTKYPYYEQMNCYDEKGKQVVLIRAMCNPCGRAVLKLMTRKLK